MVVIRACVITVLLHLSLAQDCTLLLSTSKKRWFLDSVASAFNNLPVNLKPLLPASTELNQGCRFDLTKINQAQQETLKQLSDKGYTVCVGCGLTNSDHGRCHSIDICSKGSSCISGHNNNKFPTYYFHGCCAESDSRCKSGRMDFKVHTHNTVHYTTTVCKGALCNENGFNDQKVALQQFLASSPVAATTTSIPDVPTTTAAPSAQTTTSPVTTVPSTETTVSTMKTTIPAVVTPAPKPETTVTTAVHDARSCMQCDGPPELCEISYSETTCGYPNNYCINEVDNKADGGRIVTRRCGTEDECYNVWYVTISDNDRCTSFDESQTYTTQLYCLFCCTTDNCNQDVKPASNTLYIP